MTAGVLLALGCGLGGLVAGVLITVLIARVSRNGLINQAKTQAAQIITEAERQAAIIIRDSKSSAKEMEAAVRERLDKEKQEFRRELNEIEKRLASKEQSLDNRAAALDKASAALATQERALANREKDIEKEHAKLTQLIAEETRRLEKISGLTIEQAKKELFVRLENEVRRECSLELKRIEDELRENAEKRAQWIIGEAIQRCATEHTAESTVSVVALPNDEMKGRIIGREGRNIRTLENITGVNVIIDDTPEAVVISGFDPVRREIARITLERLVQDGRIHPSRIEEMVEKVTEEMNRLIRERGEQACLEAGVHGLHPELVKLLGRFSFRTSYGQNVLRHSLEVCHLAGIMAAEMGLNIQEAKRAGLIHDIGKALTHEVEGSHAILGHDLCRRYGESEIVANAVGSHHNEMPAESVIAVLVQTADAMSAARPGARSEMLQHYIKRLEQLEQIASQFEGIDKAYAIQAGREVRIVVHPDRVSDAEAQQISRDIARKIESEMTYPGQIRVTVIRETRAVEIAR